MFSIDLLPDIMSQPDYKLQQIFYEENEELGSITYLNRKAEVQAVVATYYNDSLKIGTIITMSSLFVKDSFDPSYLNTVDSNPLDKDLRLQHHVIIAPNMGDMSRKSIYVAEQWYQSLRQFVEKYNENIK